MVNIIILISLHNINIPIIISERNDPDQASRKEKILSHLVYRLADCVVVQTNCIKNKIEKFYKKSIDVIANPLTECKTEKIDYTQKKKLIAVGRLNKQKNYSLLLKAFKEIVCEYPEYSLDIYGVGEEEQFLKQYVSELNIQKNVSFKGNVDNILEVEKEYDFFVMTSNYEGMPNALAEAMSVGMPCISTDCDGGGAAELISHEKNGLLVQKNNVEALILAMKCYIKQPDYAKLMGEKAKCVRQRLSNKNIMSQWNVLIRNVIKDFEEHQLC